MGLVFEYPFITITLRFTLTWSGFTCLGPIKIGQIEQFNLFLGLLLVV